jgi:hypothetical protein
MKRLVILSLSNFDGSFVSYLEYSVYSANHLISKFVKYKILLTYIYYRYKEDQFNYNITFNIFYSQYIT